MGNSRPDADWESWEKERPVVPIPDREKAEVATEPPENDEPVEEFADEPDTATEPEPAAETATEPEPEPETATEPEPETATEPPGPETARTDERVATLQFARLHGRLGSYKAIVNNLSRSGALVTIVDPAFESSPAESDLGLVGLRVASHFGDEMKIELLAYDISAEADVVRISEGEQDGEWAVRLGCRFRRPLGEAECKRHRIPAHAPIGQEPPPAPATGQQPAAPAPPIPAAARVSVPAGTPAAAPAGAGAPVYVVPAGAAAWAPEHGEEQLPDKVRLTRKGPQVSITDLLSLTVERRATDLHFKGGSPIRIRVDGTIKPISEEKLTSAEARGLIRSLLDSDQYERFLDEGDLDFAHTLEGEARFRINAMKTRGEVGLAIRRIPEDVPTVAQLGLAPVCSELASKARGLVLVTGPTGSGKSTTLAAMIHHVNSTRPWHILTMEDPIEYIHTERRACITQREIGRDTRDFASALRRALRQDPDVILVGEMRDLETIQLAVTAAETGHLVFATLHTTSAVLTVDRIIDVFPPAQQHQIRMQLADSLQGVVSQVLLPRRGSGVVVAQEVLVATSGVRALIREAKAPQIQNMMQTGAKDGMQTLEDSLNDLIARGLITHETALHKANHPRLVTEDGNRLER